MKKTFIEWMEEEKESGRVGMARKTRPGDKPPSYYQTRSKERLDAFDQAIKAKDQERILQTKKVIDDESGEDTFKYRSLYQISLGELIKDLEKLPQGAMVDKLEYPDNYFEDPWDIAFERGVGKMQAKELINICNSLIKAGELNNHAINDQSFVWIVANSGDPGQKILDVNPDGSFETSWPHEDHYHP
jgi:hypothetical protein